LQVVIDYPTPDFGVSNVAPTNVTFVTSFTSASTLASFSTNSSATSFGDFKVTTSEIFLLRH
jgi:hypothetical protein